MRIPLSWLKEYIPLKQPPDEIAKILTSIGIEVESFESEKLHFKNVVVGLILETSKHPNADKLTLAKVSDGKETWEVVCGAPNCRPGLKTAFAPIGAILIDENQKEFAIKKTKLRGVESHGMLCAADELHLPSSSEGIMELPDSLQEGTPLADLYSDTIIEIGLTPNLAHCFSLIGVARELSAATGIPVHDPKISLKEGKEPIEEAVRITVQDLKACPRYCCRVIKNVKIGPSPDWLKSKIEKCGFRSVNNVVDATNFVLTELGHPLHAFDYDLLDGHQIIVKKAEPGERFTTLDGRERTLTKDELMICDGDKSVALGGIMGGLNTEVSDNTKNILIESAYFDPVTIRKSSKRLGLQTDGSRRFERGADPNNAINALNRVSMLIQQVAGGDICSGIIDAYEHDFPEKIIRCRVSQIHRILGIKVSQGEVESIFQRLHFHNYWENPETIVVHAPTYRIDLTSEIDLVEEIARFYGYNNIPREGGKYNCSELPHTPIFLFEQEVRYRLIAEGLQEFLTCDLIGPTILNIIQDPSVPDDAYVKVINPTSVEQSILRVSLLPGLLQTVKNNYDHQNHHVAGFEIGRVHFKEGVQFSEQSVVGIVLSGDSRPMHWDEKPKEYDFYDLKGIIENLLYELGVENAEYKNLQLGTFHTGRQASVFIGELDVGSFGEIHPSILRRLDIPQRILFAEFNLQDLIQVAKRKDKVKPLAIYPGSERDWTVTINKNVSYHQILQYINLKAPKILENVLLLDIYRNEKLGIDYQNVTLRFFYRDPNKTIEQEVVEKEHGRLVSEVITKLGSAIKQS